MAFIVPLVAAVGSAVGSAGAAVGTAVGAGASAVGSAVAGMSLWQGLGLLGSAVSAVGALNAASTQAEAYKMQATNSIIQGNQQSIEYQRQGIQVLRKVAETDATIRARAAAGGIDPYSGSASQLGDMTFSRGLDEYNWARDNAQMAIYSGQANSSAMMTAASNAQTAGYYNAAGSLLMGAAQLKKIG